MQNKSTLVELWSFSSPSRSAPRSPLFERASIFQFLLRWNSDHIPLLILPAKTYLFKQHQLIDDSFLKDGRWQLCWTQRRRQRACFNIVDGPHVLQGRGRVVALLSRSYPGAEGPLTEIAEPVMMMILFSKNLFLSISELLTTSSCRFPTWSTSLTCTSPTSFSSSITMILELFEVERLCFSPHSLRPH